MKRILTNDVCEILEVGLVTLHTWIASDFIFPPRAPKESKKPNILWSESDVFRVGIFKYLVEIGFIRLPASNLIFVLDNFISWPPDPVIVSFRINKAVGSIRGKVSQDEHVFSSLMDGEVRVTINATDIAARIWEGFSKRDKSRKEEPKVSRMTRRDVEDLRIKLAKRTRLNVSIDYSGQPVRPRIMLHKPDDTDLTGNPVRSLSPRLQWFEVITWVDAFIDGWEARRDYDAAA